MDGEWDWDGTRYRWVRGAWVVPPKGAKVSPWAVTRRDDGQLFYSPSSWRDANGRVIPQPPALARGFVRDRADAGAAVANGNSANADAGVADAASAAADATPPEPQEERREAQP